MFPFFIHSQINLKSKIPKGSMFRIKGDLPPNPRLRPLYETTLPDPILVGRKSELARALTVRCYLTLEEMNMEWFMAG